MLPRFDIANRRTSTGRSISPPMTATTASSFGRVTARRGHFMVSDIHRRAILIRLDHAFDGAVFLPPMTARTESSCGYDAGGRVLSFKTSDARTSSNWRDPARTRVRWCVDDILFSMRPTAIRFFNVDFGREPWVLENANATLELAVATTSTAGRRWRPDRLRGRQPAFHRRRPRRIARLFRRRPAVGFNARGSAYSVAHGTPENTLLVQFDNTTGSFNSSNWNRVGRLPSTRGHPRRPRTVCERWHSSRNGLPKDYGEVGGNQRRRFHRRRGRLFFVASGADGAVSARTRAVH